MTTGEPGPHVALERVVIVGASLAGLRAAETLRQREFGGEVVVVGTETHRPYDRPPLSKKLLSGEWEPDRIHLRQPDVFDDLDVTWRLGTTATGLDIARRELNVAAGDGGPSSVIPFDGLIIATGAAPKQIGDHGLHDHVHVLRTLDDALRVRAAIAPGGRRVVVIGAGFIGLEVAATARQLGNEVIVLEGGPAPLIRGLGAEMGAAIGAMHTTKGIDLRCGVAVDGFTDVGVLIRSIDGHAPPEVLAADVIVVGVGVTPSVGWLEGSGLELRDGIVCDEFLRALVPPDVGHTAVFAAGDVARWPNPLLGHEMRVEHWTNAAEQGAHAASNMLALAIGEPMQPYAPIPFFWSDQFEHRIQFLGHAMPDDEVRVVAGSVEEGKFLALYGGDGRLHGALGVNAPRWVMPTRKLLMEQISWDEALIAAVPPT